MVRNRKGQFEGESGNPSGRPPGALNTLNADSRTKLHEIYENDLLKTFQEDLKELSASQRVQVFIKLTEFFVPKLRSESIDLSMDSMSDALSGQIVATILQNKLIDENEQVKFAGPDGREDDSPGDIT